MGNAATLEKPSISCDEITVDTLDKLVQQIISKPRKDIPLKNYVHPQSTTQINWDSLQHLRIIGNSHTDYVSRFEKSGIPRGLYCNADGSWLLVILPKNQGPNTYLRHCGVSLRSLSVENCFKSAGHLNPGHLTGLTSLRISDCGGLNDVRGLENLVNIIELEIVGSHNLTVLSGLENLNKLTKLKIYGTRLTTLPGLEHLTGLTHLDLAFFVELTTLPGLESLTGLTHLNLLHCSRLDQLPGLENLTKLTYLDLSYCQELEQLPGLEKLTELTFLRLLGCRVLKQLPGLDNLTELTHLDLSYCQELEQLPELENLTELTCIRLRGCHALEQLPGLDNLTRLTRLDMSFCQELEKLPGLDNLTRLTHLDLSYCQKLEQLPGLDNLTKLTHLNLSGCRALTDLPSLEKLTNLIYLDLSHCQELKQLLGLEKLIKLTYLSLAGCRSLADLPSLENLTKLTHLNLAAVWDFKCYSEIEKLTELSYLSLSDQNNLTQLPGLEKLTKLTDLSLSGCSNLKQLSGLENLKKLTRLFLSGCGLEQLPDSLAQCEKLRYLDLSQMHLPDLPDWIPEKFKRFTTGSDNYPWSSPSRTVVLHETTIDAILDMSIFDQSYKMVVKFFEERKRGNTRPLNEIKVVFLGDGEAGKSHTIARLMNDGGDPDHLVFDGQATPGIVIRNKEYDLGDRKIQVHYWDFGGQEIMHSMHRIFLTGRTMYVILLNARDDTQSDRAKYWLHNVKSFAPNAPVLLVLNKIDQNPNASVDEKDLRSRYDKLTRVVKLSAKDFSHEEFNDRFTDVLLDEIRKTGFLDAQWPTIWTNVKEKLENMKTHYIMGSDYQAICQECKVDDNQKNLLHWFNDLGVSFCCDGEDDYTLEDYVILRPDWITNALYIILFNALEGARNGLIPHKSIYKLLRNACMNPAVRCTLPQASYTAGDIDYVLRIMRKFNLSFTDGHDNEFIPMLCQQNSMADISYYQKDTETLEFNMEFDYLPNNLLHRLMVERYTELDMDTVWRTGARFQLKELGYSAVIVIDGNTLRFFIRHTDPMHRRNTYLTMLKAHVERIVGRMGLKAPTCQLVYKLEDGRRAEFGYDRLLKLRKRGRKEEYCEALDEDFLIEDIMNQSAPDGLDDAKKLLEAIRKSCLNIQAEPDYYLKDGENGRGMEDKRNRRICRDLELLGYDVKDQTQRGLSGTGRGVGELDLLLYNDSKEPWTIIEALRVSSGAKTEWDKHLDKLLENYNYFGAPCVYLLTYVDANPGDFQRIWKGYLRYIPGHNPGKFTYCGDSLVVHNDAPQYIKTAACRYTYGNHQTTAYHIFVRIPKQGENTP